MELKRFEDRFKQEISNLKLRFPVRQRRFDEPLPSHLPEGEGCPPVCPSSAARCKSNKKSQRKLGEQVMRFRLPGSNRAVDYTPAAYVICYSLALLVAQLGYRHRKGSRASIVYTRILSAQLQRIGMENKPQ